MVNMFTLVQGMLNPNRLRDIIQNFIYIPDTSKKDEKIVCRYPQYYAARTLYENSSKSVLSVIKTMVGLSKYSLFISRRVR
jgi:type I site-specific restriction-modification system R (restriction) subunit